MSDDKTINQVQTPGVAAVAAGSTPTAAQLLKQIRAFSMTFKTPDYTTNESDRLQSLRYVMDDSAAIRLLEQWKASNKQVSNAPQSAPQTL